MNGPARGGSLVFIYNARSGNLQALLDLVHKTLSPATYRCALCQLTYTFRMRQQWREYLEGLSWDIEFRYFDQLVEEERMLAGTLPACLLNSGNRRQLLLDADMINGCQDVAGLIAVLEEQLARL